MRTEVKRMCFNVECIKCKVPITIYLDQVLVLRGAKSPWPKHSSVCPMPWRRLWTYKTALCNWVGTVMWDKGGDRDKRLTIKSDRNEVSSSMSTQIYLYSKDSDPIWKISPVVVPSAHAPEWTHIRLHRTMCSGGKERQGLKQIAKLTIRQDIRQCLWCVGIGVFEYMGDSCWEERERVCVFVSGVMFCIFCGQCRRRTMGWRLMFRITQHDTEKVWRMLMCLLLCLWCPSPPTQDT